MNCSAHICSTGLRMKTWKMIIVSLKISFVDCSKVFFNRFVNNDLLQILWTYVNFYNRTGHMTQMFSYTKHKINFPFSWVFRSKNSNFSPIFISFKTNICFIKNWFWQFEKFDCNNLYLSIIIVFQCFFLLPYLLPKWTNKILQGNYIQEFSGRPDSTFSCKQKQNSNRFEISYRSFFISGLI